MTKTNRKVWIRRLVALAVTLAIIAALLIFVFIPIYTKTDDQQLEQVVLRSNSEVEKKYVLENDDLRFTLDGMTTQFTLENKRTGSVWRSNPERPEDDPIALSAEKNRLKSTLLLTYATSEGATTVFDNYAYSISNGVYDIEAADDEIRVNYVIGKISKIFFVPDAITRERMEQFTEGMSKREVGTVLDMYQLYDPANSKDAAKIADLLETYPDLNEQAVYVMRNNQKDNKKSKVEKLLAERGYNSEEYAYDQSRIAGESALSGAVFNVTLTYRLEGGDLVLGIPYQDIRYTANYQIINVTPLPYFGAAGTDQDGYIMVPEGGGSIIRYNNGKNSQTAYYSNLYGWDYGAARTVLINETRSNFPVYAMTAEGEAYMCLLEEGATLAGINADVSGRNNSFNTASVTYTVLHNDQYDVSAKTVQRIYMFERELPDITVTQRYRFVDSDSYVDLATAYGQYLADSGRIAPTADGDVPVVISLVGAIEKTVKRGGIPMTASVALTDFREAQAIVETLNGAGLDGLAVRYEGWANGGVSQRVFSRVKVENELGGRKGLASFIEAAHAAGNAVYLDGMSMFTYRSGLLQGFNYFADAAKHTTRDRVKLYEFSPIFFTELKGQGSFYLAKPAYIRRMADNFADAAAGLKANVSYRDMGYLLAGDYDSEGITTREAMTAQQRGAMEAAAEKGCGVMIRSGNDYALGCADIIADMDLFGNGYSIVDEDIPFYQIALHGCVNYVSKSLNMSGDWETTLLRSAEYGAGLGYTFMKASADVLVDTSYTEYTGTSWDAVKDEAIGILVKYREDMRGLNSLRITDHAYLTGSVARTTYEDGTQVYVNYGYEEFRRGRTRVPARSYLVVREGDAR
uniref:Uncharacterized protein n=1 Tax=uncultured bacterium Ad_010_C07 TaxID=1489291 RepID=A0A0B4N003_9BACT|nr:putative uncharacterized protein [uncultured bacterium Ad_010_C07]